MRDYNAMSLDELLREEKKQYASYHGEGSLHITFVICERRAARDAILDLAEQLDAEGFVLLKEVPGFEARLVQAEIIRAFEQGRFVELSARIGGVS